MGIDLAGEHGLEYDSRNAFQRGSDMRARVGDLVRRIKPNDGRKVGDRFLLHVYRVVGMRDHKPVDAPREKGALVQLETLDGEGAGWDFVWNVEVVTTVAQQELEKLKVSLARIAQKLGLNGAVPGNVDPDDYSFQSLCLQAKQPRGWNALAARCIVTIDALKEKSQ